MTEEVDVRLMSGMSKKKSESEGWLATFYGGGNHEVGKTM